MYASPHSHEGGSHTYEAYPHVSVKMHASETPNTTSMVWGITGIEKYGSTNITWFPILESLKASQQHSLLNALAFLKM